MLTLAYFLSHVNFSNNLTSKYQICESWVGLYGDLGVSTRNLQLEYNNIVRI